MIDTDVEIVQEPEFKRTIRAVIRGDVKSIAKSLERALIRSGYWPIDTGRSRSGFYAEANGNDIDITNREDYAKYVESRRNNLPALRTIERAWTAAASKALKRNPPNRTLL